LRKATELDPKYAQAHFNLGDAFYSRGRVPEALAQWREGLRAEPNRLSVLNQMAWVLATSTQPSIRDGAEAVRLAARAVEVTGGRDLAALDTLAAAYAEMGRFDQAVETARRALALAENRQPLAAAIQARIALYEGKQPFRSRR
jgi:spermidine synthase